LSVVKTEPLQMQGTVEDFHWKTSSRLIMPEC